MSTYFTHRLDKPLGRTLQAFGRQGKLRNQNRYDKAIVKKEHNRKQRQYNYAVLAAELQEYQSK